MNIQKYEYHSETSKRIDSVVCDLNGDLSRSAVVRLIENGKILVNGRTVSKSYKAVFGDIISVEIPEPVSDENIPQEIPLDIVYEDDCLLVVNKPKGMVVHPAPGNRDNTLVNALLYHCKGNLSGIGGVARPGIVHRIDKDTSGLLMVAKTDKAHIFLSEQIKKHSFTREYEAVLVGNLKEDSGEISAPIGRNEKDRKKMAVTLKNSKEAVTYYSVLKRFNGYCYVRFKLKTGRTHQIRVHSAYMGHPVVGDTVYGSKKQGNIGFEGQCLHARKIGFIHPETLEYMEFESELPDYFNNFLLKIE